MRRQIVSFVTLFIFYMALAEIYIKFQILLFLTYNLQLSSKHSRNAFLVPAKIPVKVENFMLAETKNYQSIWQ